MSCNQSPCTLHQAPQTLLLSLRPPLSGDLESTSTLPSSKSQRIMDSLDLFPPPPQDYFLDHPNLWWPAWKFGMKPEDLFTTLPREFNCITLPILDADAFSRDIFELSRVAQDRESFIQLLAERRDSRKQELWNIWLYTFQQIASSPRLVDEKCGSWPHAMHIYHSKSFDSYIRYFADFVPPIEPDTPPPSLDSPPAPAATMFTNTMQPKHTTPSDPTSESLLQQPLPRVHSISRRRRDITRSSGVQKRLPEGLRRSSRIKERNERGLSGDSSRDTSERRKRSCRAR